ncbi:MAG: heat-inducible transcriptional repressor HrcA [Candidatus Krumholzibacteria bacterium]|nr:heat-inducible transcriptional repressor HrcA [Candidatus Krumholzibacteria bacterium]MDH4337669.1 heat-inducible transcriptional repressor HrcA [Candidatus Krumholzibacteria bacterium]MDH5270251.1 heat-inducible transcriptional repressor HrcA [Candidatus Krumholzibacteria bacterium]
MLIEKDREILRTIIEVYVSEGDPVSSRRVRDAGRFAMSTATIRNRMAVLEREGLIAKAHVSSGRIPTDEGYRLHVDELQAERTLAAGEALPAVREELRAEGDNISALMLHTSQMLGAMSRNVALVYGAVVQECRVGGVRLFQLNGGRLLVVVRLVPDYERTVALRLGREPSPETVSAVEGLLNRLVGGMSLDGARAALGELVRDNVTDEGIVVREITSRREEIFSGPPAVEMCFEARGRMLDQPELSDPRTLHLLLRILHNRDYLTSILASRPLDRTQVTIGVEHGDESLRPFSLVTAGYRMGAARGVVGLMGPTRMRYDHAISLVGSVSRELRAIGEEFFQ